MVTSLPPSLIHAHILTFLPHSCTQGYLKLSIQVLGPVKMTPNLLTQSSESVDIEGYVHRFSVNEFYVLNCTLKHIPHPYIPTLPSPHTYTHTHTRTHTHMHTHTHTHSTPLHPSGVRLVPATMNIRGKTSLKWTLATLKVLSSSCMSALSRKNWWIRTVLYHLLGTRGGSQSFGTSRTPSGTTRSTLVSGYVVYVYVCVHVCAYMYACVRKYPYI